MDDSRIASEIRRTYTISPELTRTGKAVKLKFEADGKCVWQLLSV